MTNPAAIKWPRDLHGHTTKVREAIIKSVQRCNGNEQKTDVLIATLRMAAQFARTRAETVRAAQAAVREREDTPPPEAFMGPPAPARLRSGDAAGAPQAVA